MYVLDTDHLGILQRQTPPEFEKLIKRIAGLPQSDFYVTIVSFHEQMLGWNAYLARAKDLDGVVQGYRRFEGILEDFSIAQVLSFSAAAAGIFSELRKQGIRIGTMDLRIAAIAIANQMTVLSRNLIDFQQVPRLQVEDWTV